MTREERSKGAALVRILTSHQAKESGTLADLRVAGFKFTTIEQANRHLQAQRTIAALSPEQLVERIADLTDMGKRTT